MGKRSSRATGKSSSSYRKRKLLVNHLLSRPACEPNRSIGKSELPSRVDQQVQLGIESLRSGRLEDAEGYLTAAIELDAGHASANNCLGILYRAQGDTEKAVRSYEVALRSNPNYAEAHNNLGIAHEAAGRNGAAVTCYRSALRCKTDFAAAHNNLGNVLTKEGKHAEAMSSFEAALVHKPNFPAAFNNKGLALRKLGQHDAAEASFRSALRLQPNFAEAHLNLGNILRDRGALPAALECYQQALRCKPQLSTAAVCLGNACLDLGRWEEAATAFMFAVETGARNADAFCGLAAAQQNLGRQHDAAASLRSAIECDSTHVEARMALSKILSAQDDIEGAISLLRQVVRSVPAHLAGQNQLGNLFRLQDRMDEAAASYSEVLRRRPVGPVDSLRLSTLCPAVFRDVQQMNEYYDRVAAEWTSLRGAAPYRDLPDLLRAANEPPYNLQFSGGNIRHLKEAYAAIFRYQGPPYQPPRSSGPIKIGLVVTSQHEIAFLRLIWDALKRMNSHDFALSILCTSGAAPKFRSTINNSQVGVIPLPDRVDQVIDTIRSAHFDVLYYFEIGTDAINYFLPFFRLAPVQCTSWGIQVTSGIDNVDYYLSSALVEPEVAAEHYSEELVRARTLLTYQTPVELPAPPKRREAFGLSCQQTIYVCAQHLGKFHTDFDLLLGELLRRDPRGVVVITADRYGYGARRLADRMAHTIPDVSARVLQLPRQYLPDYLSLLAAADVLLDAPHFSGVNTTYDALALDQPTVSMPSQFHRGRYTFACYRKMGLSECIAEDSQQYVEIAHALGSDADYRETVRAKIRASKHRVFRDREAVDEHERIFRSLVARARAA